VIHLSAFPVLLIMAKPVINNPSKQSRGDRRSVLYVDVMRRLAPSFIAPIVRLRFAALAYMLITKCMRQSGKRNVSPVVLCLMPILSLVERVIYQCVRLARKLTRTPIKPHAPIAINGNIETSQTCAQVVASVFVCSVCLNTKRKHIRNIAVSPVALAPQQNATNVRSRFVHPVSSSIKAFMRRHARPVVSMDSMIWYGVVNVERMAAGSVPPAMPILRTFIARPIKPNSRSKNSHVGIVPNVEQAGSIRLTPPALYVEHQFVAVVRWIIEIGDIHHMNARNMAALTWTTSK
jgi:hypothetical protein